MKKVLWFSRHTMTEEQLADLKATVGELTIVNVNKTIQHASEIADIINECDIIAIVAPIGLQKEFLSLANGKPVIMAKSERILLDNGEKVVFKFVQWDRLEKIDIVTSVFRKES